MGLPRAQPPWDGGFVTATRDARCRTEGGRRLLVLHPRLTPHLAHVPPRCSLNDIAIDVIGLGALARRALAVL
jgi:hypothetical protein